MFDATKSFDDNVAAFLVECVAIDPECAKILTDNIGILIEHGSDREARGEFNKKVKQELAALSAQAPEA